MVKIKSGTPADVEMAAAFLAANGLSSTGLPSGNTEAAGTLFTIASRGGCVVGLAKGSQAREARGTGADIAGRFHVNTVLVDPPFRAAGLGEGLVRRLLSDASAAGFSTAQLWVHTDNAAALSLYGKLGFVSTAHGIQEHQLGPIQQMFAYLEPGS
jgi:ribosomal protein S18 acetylase RimI-like enzyme